MRRAAPVPTWRLLDRIRRLGRRPTVRRLFALSLLALALGAACGGSRATPAEPDARARDVELLVEHVERAHPDPWHAVERDAFLAAAAALEERLPGLGRDATLVELMRLLALLGERDGHSGLFPLDPAHREPLHLYPVRLFDFDDGLRVVGQVGGGSGLLGARLLAVAGVPAERLAQAVAPLVPADNAQSRRARVAQWLVVAEVLHGLGLTRDAGPAALRFQLADGRVVERTLAPVAATRWAAAFPDLFHPMVPQGLPRLARPAFLARRNEPGWARRVDRGRAVHVAYNVTLGSSAALGATVRRLAAPASVRRIVLDLRHNPGGENAAANGLLEALRALGRRKRVVVLVSRTTFSAAAILLARLERATPLTIVGEASGASPHLYGDPSPLGLPETGWAVHVAAISWEESRAGAGDPRDAFAPDAAVPVRWADLARGRDRALEVALRVATARAPTA